MSFVLEVFILGLVLSADSFSAAVAMGSRRFTTKTLLKFAIASATAETLAVIVGYFAGAKIVAAISAYDHWIAFSLLMAIAVHLLYEGVQGLKRGPENDDTESETEHSFLKILAVSIATSMDAFGVGITLGIGERPLLAFSLSIAAWAFAATIAGVYIGNRASRKLGPVFTLVAGIVLGCLAFKMLSI